MSNLREKVGQLFMVGLPGDSLTADEKRTLREYPFGGFILFGHNCREPEQIAAFCRELWSARRSIPPFIAIDHEGGPVHRLPAPFTHFPAARVIGATGAPVLARRVALAMAAELSVLGVNLNFAPVLDVDSNPRNPIIGERAFAATPREVIAFSRQFIRGFKEGGVIACGKHFPGHGDTMADSHVELPIVEKQYHELLEVEMPPFIQACRARIPCMMTAHVLYPALDATYPATLSHAIVTGMLRRWRRNAVIFSDDLAMAAIRRPCAPEETPRLAIAAGVDVLLYGQEPQQAYEAFDRVVRTCERDQALAARVEESFRRVCALKNRHLRAFTGLAGERLRRRLWALPSRRLCDEIREAGRRCNG